MNGLFPLESTKEYELEVHPAPAAADLVKLRRDDQIGTFKFLKKLPISICIFRAETDELIYVNDVGKRLLEIDQAVDFSHLHLFELLISVY